MASAERNPDAEPTIWSMSSGACSANYSIGRLSISRAS